MFMKKGDNQRFYPTRNNQNFFLYFIVFHAIKKNIPIKEAS